MSLDSILDAFKVKVKTPRGDLSIRGLSLADIIYIIGNDRAAAEGAFARFTDLGDNSLNEAFLAGEMLQHMPGLAAQIIACATDEPEACEKAGKLPAGLQLQLLQTIIAETAAIEGGMGKVIEIVIGALVGTQSVVAQIGAIKR